MVSANDVRAKYLKFFKDRGHIEIPSAPLVPENDPTTLFTGFGMQPMLPYLLGQPHPLGTRLVDSQKCFRSQDIEEVGDNCHTTFFEMLGNWSLGDYFKAEQQAWIWEFFTKELGLDPKRLYVSVFEGNNQVPRDEEAADNWKKLGVSSEHIFYYGVEKNWWARSSYASMPIGEPGGPDSEVFYDFGTPHDPKFGDSCHPNCDCGRFLEIGNNVFMTYQKTKDGFEPLAKKNIDFGGGLERITAAVNHDPDIFKTDLFSIILKTVEDYTDKKYSDDQNKPAMRTITDHLKAATFLMVDGVTPSNKTQGYFLRRLLRRAAVKMHQLKGGLTPIPGFQAICHSVLETYRDAVYFEESKDRETVRSIIEEEMSKFSDTLDRGLREFNKYQDNQLNALNAFNLYQTYGFPYEVTEELFKQKGKDLDKNEFDHINERHKKLSRTASASMFKGGLQDQSEIVTKYHTATHLLHAALRRVLGIHVSQKGSNITVERLRFDFSHPEKLTDDKIKQVEEIVNKKIGEDIKIERVEMPKAQALAEGALAFFPEKYPEVTSVYSIGDFSQELCGGPHVQSTGEIGRIKITRQEAVSAGVRRIYATAVS
ncbi:MAG: Alanine-tRNA ligase [Candidatus Amesbacteria bacterium GW2011_GWB1_47_26]|uniref:alanine--tRNA ligase n=1 Tax=Candidatus Amesbacteria bacterium GW2011_GWC2_45_19 TaxID=1618366 RepID=A0A0G1Q2Z5_9BACT|nr:MAG: Alanine-tRNA ligase [Candidatus Amesbacteria bacterium GW2011_GWC2_45_19]KKU38496.1 MAG: Alanine-tRNA ligase [Candidatus Amesbacteria bacterium GW2011_GWA1_46_35]KKU69215.1 MAG: Alanine-tRNA ligase [Microgenomates group bacterium GW2011_GWC1_47_20]KKU74475.1 MAG: Alanine-tRNA ligase [Candidatus Amesbacteria bacterium GW2011_GWB1_47_26]KKU79510.1 MAG: Alanine-tRNA ligase [Candidatus Amesbacteria bacterium GW2011_GWA2_47_70]